MSIPERHIYTEKKPSFESESKAIIANTRGKVEKLRTDVSIVDYLKSIGKRSDYKSRKNLAIKHGIQNYRGTAKQNVELLNIVKNNGNNMANTRSINIKSLFKRVKKISSVKGIDILKDFEGFRNNAYQDSAGVWTIGYGFTSINGKRVKKGDFITRSEADREFIKQKENHSNYKKLLTRRLNKKQEDALASFEYNLGSNIWYKNKNIMAYVNNGYFRKAGNIMKLYNKARDPKTGRLVRLRGLVKRRRLEARMLLG